MNVIANRNDFVAALLSDPILPLSFMGSAPTGKKVI